MQTRGSCIVGECSEPNNTRGYCKKHYQWARRQNLIEHNIRDKRPFCTREGCTKRPTTHTECADHRGRTPKPKRKPCSFDACGNYQHRNEGYCYWHAQQKRRGEELRPVGTRRKADMDTTPCSAYDCKSVPIFNGMCKIHWELSEGTGVLPPLPPEGLNECPILGCDNSKRAAKVLCQKHRAYAAKFNMPPHEYRDKINAGCTICGSYNRMAIDHDHDCCPKAAQSCGKCIRGALCGNCNNMLGHAKGVENLIRGAEYLKRFTRP